MSCRRDEIPGLSLEQKATLLALGSIAVDDPEAIRPFLTTATAGPGAGGTSLFLNAGGRRVRLSLNPDSPLLFVRDGETARVVRRDDGEIVAVCRLERPLCHCPRQAYLTIGERCIYSCRFCPVPRREGGVKTDEEVRDLVRTATESGELEAISITSGVIESPAEDERRIAGIVRMLASEFGLPIGVSIYPTPTSTGALFAAGAVEIKYNLETATPELFREACPDLSREEIETALLDAVRVFGRGRVASNILVGIGETDDELEALVASLTADGIIPVIRPVNPGPARTGGLTATRPDAARLLRLASMTKRHLDRHGLDPRQARTMCLPCTGCDLVPGIDL